MSLGLLVAGTIFQLMVSYMAFIGAIFGGGAAASNKHLSPLASQVLEWAIYVLPGLSVLSALAVIALYLAGASSWALLLHLLPVAALALYGWYVFGFLAR